MKLAFIFCVLLLAAMGPSRHSAPQDLPVSPQVAEDIPAPAPESELAEPVLSMSDAATVTPQQLMWKSRIVAVFADTSDDPSYAAQIKSLRERPGPLVSRDVVVITDTDPAGQSLWRRQLHPRGFSLVIIDKDGEVKLRKPLPWDVREITRAIDKFPLRRQEINRAGVIR